MNVRVCLYCPLLEPHTPEQESSSQRVTLGLCSQESLCLLQGGWGDWDVECWTGLTEFAEPVLISVGFLHRSAGVDSSDLNWVVEEGLRLQVFG